MHPTARSRDSAAGHWGIKQGRCQSPVLQLPIYKRIKTGDKTDLLPLWQRKGMTTARAAGGRGKTH